MELYLSVPGGKPIGDLHDEILGLGFDGVRVDIPDDHQAATEVLREFADRPNVRGIFLIAGGHMTRNHPEEGGAAWTPDELVAHVDDCCVKILDLGLFSAAVLPAIEIGNEPDLATYEWKKNPRELARTFNRCYDVVRKYSASAPVLSPSISNLNERGFEYLELMAEEGLPAGCHIAAHRYPNGPSVDIPHDGFRSRAAEVRRLLAVAELRSIWITETGMHEGPHTDDKLYLSEEDVAREFEKEVMFWDALPQVAGFVWYQINDGPDRENQLDTYGIRTFAETWKVIAEHVAEVKERLG